MRHYVGVLLALCLALTGSAATAVERGTEGFGQVLIFPYATGNAAINSLLTVSVAAPRESGLVELVVARVVVHLVDPWEGGRETSHAYTVFIDSHDTWTMALHGSMSLQLSTTDRSCALDSQGKPVFGTQRLLSQELADGWIEVYELGSVTDPDILAHSFRDCDGMAARIAGRAAADWLDPPANRLRGSLHLVHHWRGTAHTVAPTTLLDFRDAPWWPPGAPYGPGPTLQDVQPPTAVVRLAGSERRRSTFSAHPVDAVSAVLTDARWDLDFSMERGLNALTELVILAPTWRWYAQGRAPFALADGQAPTWTAARTREGSWWGTSAAKCTPPPPFADRAEGPTIGSPLVVGKYGASNSVFLYRDTFAMQHSGLDPGTCSGPHGRLAEYMDAGRMVLEFDASGVPGVGELYSDEGHAFHGLPLIGFGATVVEAPSMHFGPSAIGLEQPIARRTRYDGEH